MKYASNNIRNILIAGHAGSGKTTLTEALVYFSGAAERMGRVEDGTTISDFDPEEAKRKASLSASVVPVEYEGIKYNLIDAPGLFDFEAGEYEGIRAAESVLVCVSGRSGVTVGAEKAFQLARKNGKATMVFISKCDLENANYFKILEEMKIKFGSTVCPCVVPAKLDDGTPVYINLFSQKAFKYESGKQIQVELPDIGHRFQGLIEAMSEAIAETDDELMEKFFGGEPFTTEEIVEGMRKGVKDGLITPVFCGSAVNQQALDMLLFNMHKLLPSPQHDAAILAENASGEPVELHCDETEPTAAYVFKTVADPFVGKLSYLRVISGKVTGGAALVNARTGETEKISKPLTVIGKKQTETDGIGAGDIGAVAKLVSAKTGDTLCDADRVVKLPAPVFPKPSLFMAVTVAKKGDEGKISSALARLMEEDPTLSYVNNAETHQMVLSGAGDMQVDVLVNNAGILPKFKRFDRYSDEEIERAININFYSCVYSVKTFLPMLLQSTDPGIVNIDSSAALMSLAGTSMYSASKAALKGFTEALREEFRGKCYVGLVCPGFTKTDIFRGQSNAGGKGEKVINMISTDCDLMVKMIMFGIEHKQALQIHGVDAHAMSVFGKLLPVNGSRLFSAVMKAADIDLFKEVFKDDAELAE